MFNVKLAGLNICINNKYDYIGFMCSEYITSVSGTEFSVAVSTPEIMAEDDGTGHEAGYLESLAVYRKIAERIIDYDGFLMHGVVVEVEGTGIAFLADSGVGKTTHAKLWQQLLGDGMTIINGDKPLVRVIDGEVFAYGTPWSGKEGIHKNARTHLKKICFLERSEENKCTPIGREAAFDMLLKAVYKPKCADSLPRMIEILENVMQYTEFYKIKCNTDLAAAKTAFEGMMP